MFEFSRTGYLSDILGRSSVWSGREGNLWKFLHSANIGTKSTG